MNRLLPSLLLAATLLLASPAQAQWSVSVRIGPPMLPVFSQPRLPGAGYLWTPGYWAWNPQDQDYFWVPGTWVRPPRAGLLWTPGYWAQDNTGFRWRIGYWGSRVGFYGGVQYGHGYNGAGYDGGRWRRGVFQYNTRDNNVDRLVVRNVYTSTVVRQVTVNRVSYNGGPAGLKARPDAAQVRLASSRQVAPTPAQVEHQDQALKTPGQRASLNKGQPPTTATERPNRAQAVPTSVASSPAAAPPARSAREARRAERAASQPATARTPRNRPDAAASAPRPGAKARRPADSASEPGRRQPKRSDDGSPSRPREPGADTPQQPQQQQQPQQPQQKEDGTPRQPKG